MSLPVLERPILNGKVNFPVCLAPMVGLSHVAFRRLLRHYLPPGAVTLWPTEMLNSRRLPYEDLSATPETLRFETDTELVPQILGNSEEFIAPSVRRLREWGAEGIDINMGCPVQRALRHNYGVALMGDPDYAAQVTAVTVKNAQIPVSVKLRAGTQGDKAFLLRFVQGLEAAGASWLCLHPRTAEQKRRGRADWDQIGEVRAQLRLPVVGNGDVQVAADVETMRRQTHCDMVMVGRALTARPWMLRQLGQMWGFVSSGEPIPYTPEEEGAEYGRALLIFLTFCEHHFSPTAGGTDLALRKFRFFVKTGSPWLFYGHQLYAHVCKAKTPGEMRHTLTEFFSVPHAMMERTELRQ